jgi:hypothetical protein
MKKLLLVTCVSLTSTLTSTAQIVASNWTGGVGGNWSDTNSWHNKTVPNSNSNRAQGYGLSDTEANLDGNYTVSAINAGPKGATWTIGGSGTLTIDAVSDNPGIRVTTGNADPAGTLLLNGNFVINNSNNVPTNIQVLNNGGNKVVFGTSSVLTVNTLLDTVNGVSGGRIEMNGTLAASAANLRVNSTNLSFGNGHDSTAFGRDIVLFNGAKLTVDGGSVLNVNRKFQVNGNSELVLNGANSINGANVVIGGNNNLLIDVNANQANMGSINLEDGTLTIDIDASVTGLVFADSSAQTWGSGLISVVGFREGVIQFGTDGNGLSAVQLAAINSGAYSLNSSGFLTAVPEPKTYALVFGLFSMALIFVRRKVRNSK